MVAAMKRAALYARVSTQDRGQDPETQLRELRRYAVDRGFEDAGEYVDQASGRTEERPAYKRLMADVRRRKVDVVLVFRFSRFARSTRALVNALTDFRDLGVDFISLHEAADTTTAQGRLLFGILASLAEFESDLIAENVRSGMSRAKAQGRRISRPRIPLAKRRRIVELHRQGRSLGAIASELGIAKGTVWNYCKTATDD